MSVSKIVAAAASGVGGAGLDVDEVFDTFLYEGDSSTQTITNGIDLSGKGGLVWIKKRDGTTTHSLVDSERGDGKMLQSNSTDAEISNVGYAQALTSTGFTVYDWTTVNNSGDDYVAWTFRKAEKFFDIVTYTGDGDGAKTISHNLGSVPGMIIVKPTSTTGNWNVYHRKMDNSSPQSYGMYLNETDDRVYSINFWNETAPTSTQFSINSHSNSNTQTYVAYLFAHNNNDGEFGPDGDADIIKCGSYTGNAGSQEIDLGFEPQWVMIKNADNAHSNWAIWDVMRGFTRAKDASDPDSISLYPNTSGAESGIARIYPHATGFGFVAESAGTVNSNGSNIIYMAIRRGPLAVPDDATKVFSVLTGDGNGDSTTPQFASGFSVDTALIRSATGTANNNLYSRLTANKYISTNSSAAEVTDATDFSFAANTGWYLGGTTWTSWMWKRAPSYFDVSTYTGTGSARTVSHNLGVVPEMIWVKCRSHAESWVTYHKNMDGSAPEDYGSYLNDSVGRVDSANFWNDTAPTSSVFTVGTASKTNGSSKDYIAMLFASVEGVSKLGGYTGDGTTDGSKVIDCGFAPRFILIKKAINGNGNWRYYDTHRGIVAGGDAALLLNQTDAQNSTADSIDPHVTGFTVIDGNTNANTDGYIFYAIA